MPSALLAEAARAPCKPGPAAPSASAVPGHAHARESRELALAIPIARMDAFLIPSVFGDEPQLQEFRCRMRDAMAFEVLALPDAGARGALLTDMAETGRALAAEAARRRPAGPVALVGFSFGASMALEVAVQLADAGREIAFLGIIDGPFEPPRVEAGRRQDGILGAPRSLLKSVVVDAAEALGGVRRLVEKAAAPESAASARAEPMRRAMLWHLRNKALTGWKPRPCLAPGLHVCSGDYGPSNRARWTDLCPNLVRVEVTAAHERLLQDDALEAVVPAMTAAVRRGVAAR